MEKTVQDAIIQLGKEFPLLNWNFRMDASHELVSGWLGSPADQVMVCAFHGKRIDEPFHRQDFFFLNFAYKGAYTALSNSASNAIRIREHDCYIGQPYSGYAIRVNSRQTVTIIGVLIRKEVFFREFLPTLTLNDAMYRFFLTAETNRQSQECIHLTFSKEDPVWHLLDLMLTEYADRRNDTPSVLKPMALSLCMMIARKWKEQLPSEKGKTLSGQIMDYIHTHIESASLSEIGKIFGYHPGYLSTLLHQETGKTFSALLLELRMERAALLLSETGLSVEEVAASLGYSNASNFYKAFKKYYGHAPRQT
ncbi:MAG: helix-turn-helix transcriptional regulator [Lachnospiraceae bacterium]|nr:helix-turn-helix transcriptional regulator [Lachnospiraceae bacterium]